MAPLVLCCPSRGPQTSEFVINADSRIQVLDDMTLLARARKHQYAAFIRDEGVLCVWSDNVKTILAEAEGLEDSLLEYIWNQGHKREKKVGVSAFVEAAKAKELLELDEKIEKLETGLEVGDAEDLLKLKSKRQWKERPYVLFDAVTGGLTVGLMVILLSISWRKCHFCSMYSPAKLTSLPLDHRKTHPRIHARR